MIELTDASAQIIAERFRALGEPMRLRLLQTLRAGEASVSELVDATAAGQANVSKHLQVLLRHGFVERRKEGTTVRYRIADPDVFRLCDMVCGGIRDDLDQRRRRTVTEGDSRRAGRARAGVPGGRSRSRSTGSGSPPRRR
jgi:ArsR family transcriptional regulator